LQLHKLEELRLNAYESSHIYKEKTKVSMIGEFYTGSLLPGENSFYLILVSHLCAVNFDLDGMVPL